MILLKSGVGNYISNRNKQYSYFAGNDYLGLANHPKMMSDVTDTIEKYGINFSASRKTTGTSDIHLQLEELLSDFKNSMLETKLGLGCSVHFAAGLGGFNFVDLDPHLDPEKDPFNGGPEFNEPFYSISNSKAGIGIFKK